MMRKFVALTSKVNQKVALGAMWLNVVMIAIVTYDVLMRYLFNNPSIWVFESAMILGGAAYLLSWGESERVGQHLRVDVLYTHCSPRWQAIIDILGITLCWYPLFIALLTVAIPWTIKSWRIHEKMMESYWYPPFAPSRTIIVIGLFLFTAQITVTLIRQIRVFRTGEPL
jgi:TRAP-type mannitol/chloroaromatic compound transport system permease small subunit